LSLLVAGNAARLLDDRRTPVQITAVDCDDATFELEIKAFEDEGARWRLPFEDVGRYQFAADARTATELKVAAFAEAASRFDRPLAIDVQAETRAGTLARLQVEADAAAQWLAGEGLRDVDVVSRIEAREADDACARLLHEFLDRRNLLDMEEEFARVFVSNPSSGELVKGHAIVLAELGLCPYVGKVVRSSTLFAGDWSRERRSEHLIARLAFTQAMWRIVVPAGVPLYRALSSDERIERNVGSFVSATLSREVAMEHFVGSAARRSAALLRQAVPVERLFMTFLETPAMSRQFKEAEAVLIGDPANALF
jgi:hypothetical protein